MTAFFTVIAAIIIFALLIFIHELGHFVVAKLTGIKVLEFALGMGPTVVSTTKGETKYSIRALPIGGFCAMEGEDSASEDQRAMSNKPAWVKLLVLVAGAFMNILLGFVLLALLIGSSPKLVTTTIGQISENSAADLAGIKAEDQIIKMDRSKIHIADDIHWKAAAKKGNVTEFTVKSGNEIKTFSVTPQSEDGKFIYGFSLKTEANGFVMTIRNAYYETLFYSKVILETLVNLFRGEVKITEMSGPIGIVSEIGSAVKESVEVGYAGFLRLINLAILLTINLGVFNLLPIPALDGGRILFVLVEMVRRKPLPPEKEGMVHFIGFAALILLSVFVAYMDVLKLWK